MNIGSKLPWCRGALNRCHHLAINDKTAQVLAVGFFDKFLHQKIRPQGLKGINHRLGGLFGLGQYHTSALRAFQQLNNKRRTTHHLNQIVGIHG